MCSVKLGWEFDCSCWFCLLQLVPSSTFSLLSCPWPPPSSSEDFLCVVLTVALSGRVSVVQWYLFVEGIFAFLGLHRAREDPNLARIKPTFGAEFSALK